jgi:hypothetical protein
LRGPLSGNPGEWGRALFTEGNTMSLLERIEALQRRADAMKGKPGYLVALARLRDAKLAALMVKKYA